ncbi:MAG TPA: hypothetical protein VNM37_08625, partial [Candidatus Dormibacteraeota bacterium]|nr:hypothetical protein [Candidatus Dormibacteraeota bacterium]
GRGVGVGVGGFSRLIGNLYFGRRGKERFFLRADGRMHFACFGRCLGFGLRVGGDFLGRKGGVAARFVDWLGRFGRNCPGRG